MTIDQIQTVASLIISIGGASIGLLAWYRGAVEKKYAAERSFNHVRGNQEALLAALKQLDEEVEEIKALVNDRFYQLNNELVRLQAIGSGDTRKKLPADSDRNRE